MSSPSDHVEIDLFEGIDERSMAGADFTAEIIGELRRAFASLQRASGLTQKEIADRLGVSKSAVHRWLHGDGNMTLRKLGEFAWALGCRTAFRLTPDLLPSDALVETDQQIDVPAVLSSTVVPASAEGQPLYFRLETIGQDEAMRIIESIEPSAPQLQFIGRNNSSIFRQCIVNEGKYRAVGYFERLPIDAIGQLALSPEVDRPGGVRMMRKLTSPHNATPVKGFPHDCPRKYVGAVA